MSKYFLFILSAFLVRSPLSAEQVIESAEEVFTRIYDHGIWGVNEEGIGHSGGGSTVESSKKYMIFLQNFLKRHNIKSVVDVGCGDWEFSQHIDWSGIDYTGVDVVESVIARNNEKFGCQTIRFLHGDSTQMNLPKADLLICKDVMQHLMHEDIFNLCAQMPKYKHCLFTNDVDPSTSTSLNDVMCPRGPTRQLDLTRAPFFIRGEKVLTYNSDKGATVKQVLHVFSPQKNYRILHKEKIPEERTS